MTCEHGEPVNVIKRTDALPTEGTPHVPHKNLRPLVETDLYMRVHACVCRGGLFFELVSVHAQIVSVM